MTFLLGKVIICACLSTPTWPHKNECWAWNPSWPRDKEPTESLFSLSLCVGILFPASGLMNVPLFYRSMCINGPYVCPLHPRFQYVRLYKRGIGILLLQHKWCAYRPTALHQMLGTHAGHEELMNSTGADLTMSLLYVSKSNVTSSAWLLCYPWQLCYLETAGRSAWTSIPVGRHCDDLAILHGAGILLRHWAVHSVQLDTSLLNHGGARMRTVVQHFQKVSHWLWLLRRKFKRFSQL